MAEDSAVAVLTSPRPLRGPFSRWPVAADTLLALVIFALELAAVALREVDEGVAVNWGAITDVGSIGVAILAAGAGVLIGRRRFPMAVLTTTVATVLLWSVAGKPGGPLLATLVALYGVGRYVEDTRRSAIAVAVCAVISAGSGIADSDPAASVGFDVLVVLVPWYVGRRLRIRGRYMAVLEERAVWVERERAAERRQAAAEERSRIARELHDVVAHRVSMMTVQAGAAGTVAADDPEGAVAAMHAVESEGRQALGELRHLLGVLRPAGDPDTLEPHHGLGDVPELVESFRDRGMDIGLVDRVSSTAVPAPVGLSAYRIVQEALTNVLKHAGTRVRAEVRLSSYDGMLVVEVVDDGTGDSILPGSGHGIIGMRERTALLGGELHAGRRPGGGFRVRARLPMDGVRL